MTFCIFSLLILLVVAGATRLKVWDSSSHMINAEWLASPEKFELIARWGARS